VVTALSRLTNPPCVLFNLRKRRDLALGSKLKHNAEVSASRAREDLAVWTEENDLEIEYGKWQLFDAKTCLAEEHRMRPLEANDDIWPHWSEGRPTFLRRNFYSDSFYNGRVYHRPRECYASLELK
jgi:hypothetical protein